MHVALQPNQAKSPISNQALIRPDGRVNAMSVDVEEHFQVHAFARVVGRDDWPSHESRVERNTDRVLSIFADQGIKSTFFVLGWVAERHPALIQRIVQQGHELASHGYCHIRADRQEPEAFREDIRRTKGLLEDAGGMRVNGYRAASFSINRSNWWAFDVLAEEGYRYSSSVFPVHHDQYGVPDAPRDPFAPSAKSPGLLELPMSTVRVFGQNLPCSGGGYFRMFPYAAFSMAVRRLNRTEHRPCMFYFHPWEIDPDQPRIPGAGFKSNLRHYTNLDRMEGKLRRLLREFAWDRVDRVYGLDSAPRA